MPGSLTAEQETAAGWKAGVAEVAITPQQPMWMAGYSNRVRPAEEKLHDLRARVLAIEDTRANRAVLIAVEVTGIDRRFSVRLCDALAKEYQLQRRQIAICSTHTHSGPVTSDRFPFVFGLDERQDALRREYLAALHEKLVTVVGDALEALAPARLAWGTGSATFAANRRNNPAADGARLRETGTLRGPFDHDVPVLSVSDGHEKLKAVVFGYACHATTFGPSNYQWSGDFFGFAQDAWEADHPGCMAIPWAGCGGDQNPIPRLNIRWARQHGRELAAAIDVVLAGKMVPVRGTLGTRYEEIELPFVNAPTIEQLQREAASGDIGMSRRAKFLLRQVELGIPLAPSYSYPVQAWRIGAELLFITLGGEVVVDYALKLKHAFGRERTWVASYANDVMAYIPSVRVLQEGGYEGRTGFMIYGLPAPWTPQIEPLILYQARRQLETLGVAGWEGPDPERMDFEFAAGTLDPNRWYVGGGIDATRPRVAARGVSGSWSLSTAGDEGEPFFVSNVFRTAIDANTSVTWGPVFRVNEKLPAGAGISMQLAGGTKPWKDSGIEGPTGVALWDLAARDFARHANGEALYATREKNGFSFQAAFVALAGLEERTLALTLVDRAMQSWAWTSIDDIVFSPDSVTFSKNKHHRVEVINDFDDERCLEEWTGDVAGFQLGRTGAGGQTLRHVNRNVRSGRARFPATLGYLSSTTADGPFEATGAIRSPLFTLRGDVIEFYLAGSGGSQVSCDLVTDEGDTLAAASPQSAAFVYHLWPISDEWIGRRAYVRLVDRSERAYIEVDAIRMLDLDVPAEGEDSHRDADSSIIWQWALAMAERQVSSGRGSSRVPIADVGSVATATANRSGGKPVIHPTSTYTFDTQQLNGEIRPYLPKPGIVRCRHKPTQFDIVPEIPMHALLMPEWLLRAGKGRQGIFWHPLCVQPRVSVERGSVFFHVGAEQTQDWNMDVTFRYTPKRDWIDFECQIVPHVAIQDFEFFIASYVTEAMESTWVSAAVAGGEEFKKLDCRRTEPWGSVFTVARDAQAKAYLSDGRWNLPQREAGKDLWQDFYFRRPVLVAMDEATGLAVIIMVDPNVCSLLGGQHHLVETAHDFAFNADLEPEQPFVGRSRLVIRNIGTFPEATSTIDELWRDFQEFLGD